MKETDTLKALKLILAHEGLCEMLSRFATDSYKAYDAIIQLTMEEFFETIPKEELDKNFEPGKAYIDFDIIVGVFMNAENYAKTHRWQMVEKK